MIALGANKNKIKMALMKMTGKSVLPLKVENRSHVGNWPQTTVFIGDKDFADRSVYTDCFPNAVLKLCLFHVLQIFNIEITSAKRNLTAAQRQNALEILQKIAYSQ